MSSKDNSSTLLLEKMFIFHVTTLHASTRHHLLVAYGGAYVTTWNERECVQTTGYQSAKIVASCQETLAWPLYRIYRHEIRTNSFSQYTLTTVEIVTLILLYWVFILLWYCWSILLSWFYDLAVIISTVHVCILSPLFFQQFLHFDLSKLLFVSSRCSLVCCIAVLLSVSLCRCCPSTCTWCPYCQADHTSHTLSSPDMHDLETNCQTHSPFTAFLMSFKSPQSRHLWSANKQ